MVKFIGDSDKKQWSINSVLRPKRPEHSNLKNALQITFYRGGDGSSR